jgi:hypothetical protein
LIAHYRDRIPPPQHFELLEELRVRVKEAAAQASNRPQFEYFGSNKSGFCSKGADADMSFTYRSYSALLHGIPKYDEQNTKRMIRFSRALKEAGMSGVKYVEARIPVVSFQDEATGVQVDVTIGNVGGAQNSAILRLIRDTHPVSPLYVHCVKEWAKSKEVIAPEKSCFNSFTVTTMAIMVLQELGVLPVFSKTTGLGGVLTLEDAKLALDGWKLPQAYDAVAVDDDVMADALMFLLSKFAEYYSAFDVTRGTVSIIMPRRVRPLYAESVEYYLRCLAEEKRAAWDQFYKENKMGNVAESDFAESMRTERVQRPETSPVVVEDFVNFVNCGRRLTQARAEPVFANFKTLRESLVGSTVTTAAELYKPLNRFNRTHVDAAATRRVRTF